MSVCSEVRRKLGSSTSAAGLTHMLPKYSKFLEDHKVAIVCSARSTDTKAEGTTNRYRTALPLHHGLVGQRMTDHRGVIG